MRERGMIFNAEMVRAILNGSKTQARRIVKPQYQHESQQLVKCEDGLFRWWIKGAQMPHGGPINQKHGKVGDRIWVRETFAKGLCTKSTLAYRATHKPEDLEGGFWETIKWTPSLHMPRWASRILLEITNMRVERLQDISDEDCIAEGIIPVSIERDLDHQFWRDYRLSGDGTFCVNTPRESFESLWKSVRGKSFDSEEDTGPGSWYSNPWVWVIEFKRVEASNEQ